MNRILEILKVILRALQDFFNNNSDSPSTKTRYYEDGYISRDYLEDGNKESY